MKILGSNRRWFSQENAGNRCADSSSEKKTYSGVDIFKFFFAVCVVALHTNAIKSLPETAAYMITRLVFRVAVPYFFVATGFFLGKKLNSVPKNEYACVVRAYCLRLLKPLIFFEIISLAYNTLRYMRDSATLMDTILALGKSIIFYPAGALWYVQACIIGVLLLYPFLKRNKLNLALIIGVFLYGFALIANNYSFVIVNTPFEKVVNTYLTYCVSARNGLFTGFLSIALGIVCSRVYNKFHKQFVAVVIFVLSGLCYIAEVIFIYTFNKTPLDDSSLYITHLIFIPALFLITLRLKVPVPPKLSVTFRNLSTGIYFLHRPLSYIYGYFIDTDLLEFAIVMVSATLICLFAYKTRVRPLYGLLK